MAEFIFVDYLTSVLSVSEIVVLAIILVFLKRIVEPHAKKQGISINYSYFHLAIILYFLYKASSIIILFYGLTDLFIGIFIVPGIFLFASGALIYTLTQKIIDCCRSELDGF